MTSVSDAHGQAADLARGRQVLLEQRRRDAQHAGDVVEPVALIVGGQQIGDVDFEVEQVANRVAVFGPVQPMDRLDAGIGCCRAWRRACLERDDERFSVGSSGRGIPCGGIMPPCSLTTPSPRSRHARRLRRIDAVEGHAAGLGAIVVAAGAVLLNERLIRKRRGRRRGGRRSLGAGAAAADVDWAGRTIGDQR